jgi:hypothetical protein
MVERNKSSPLGIEGAKVKLRSIAIAGTIVGVLSATILFNEFHAISSDAGQHYALIRALMNGGGAWRRPVAPYLTEGLISYPAFSHWLAAQVGLLFGSGLMGMTIVASASVGLFYFAMYLIAQQIDWRAPLIACAITVGYAFLRGPVFGRMVVNNYFYAQLVGSSIAGLTLLIVTAKLHEWNGLILDIFVIGAVQLIVATHLLPAAQLSAIYCTLLFILAVRRASWWSAGRLVLFVAISVGLTTLSPAAIDVYKIAQSEGGAHINLFGDRTAQLVLLIGGIWASGKLLRHARHVEGASLVLGSAGLGVCLYALLQVLLFWSGFGSNYAIAKNMFVVMSILIFVFSANLALSRITNRSNPAASFSAPLIACAVLALVTTRADLYPSVSDIKPVVKFQTAAREMAARWDQSDPRRPIVISNSWPRNLSYGMTIGDMQLPMGIGETTLDNRSPPEGTVSMVFLPAADAAKIPACRLEKYSNDVAIAEDYGCFVRSRTLLAHVLYHDGP